MSASFIALDWGTSSFRAYLVGGDGAVVETLSAAHGILSVENQAFDEALESHIGKWDVALPILASGMITSRQGWVELPYVACPATLKSLAASLHTHISRRGRRIHFVPGVSTRDRWGIPDVMRGEETQVAGAASGGVEYFITPGTHSKWISCENGEIRDFATYMTGEVFALLKNHSILGRLMTGEGHVEQAYERGVRKGLDDGPGFLHGIFSARTLALFNEMPFDQLGSYLSGQVIGTEIAHAVKEHARNAKYTILASTALAELYASAMAYAGLQSSMGEPDVAVRGLERIGRSAGVVT